MLIWFFIFMSEWFLSFFCECKCLVSSLFCSPLCISLAWPELCCSWVKHRCSSKSGEEHFPLMLVKLKFIFGMLNLRTLAFSFLIFFFFTSSKWVISCHLMITKNQDCCLLGSLSTLWKTQRTEGLLSCPLWSDLKTSFQYTINFAFIYYFSNGLGPICSIYHLLHSFYLEVCGEFTNIEFNPKGQENDSRNYLCYIV